MSAHGDQLVALLDDQDETSPLPEHLEATTEALGALMCPWFRGVGICESGCHDEPACQTGEPTQGWTGQLLQAATELHREAAGLDAVPQAYVACGRCEGAGVLGGWQGRCPQCGGVGR